MMQIHWNQLNDIGHYTKILAGVLIYHERETKFSNGKTPFFSYSWFSFTPHFFTCGDPPTYPCVSYVYKLLNNVEGFALDTPIDVANEWLKKWCHNLHHTYLPRYSHDDYVLASLFCEGLGMKGIFWKRDNMLILSNQVSKQLKLVSVTHHQQFAEENLQEEENQQEIHFTLIPTIFTSVCYDSSPSLLSSYRQSLTCSILSQSEQNDSRILKSGQHQKGAIW